MQNILAERTVTVELDGQPATTIRVVVGWPTMVEDGEWQTPVEVHGPEAGSVSKQLTCGIDAWQSVRSAFWIAVVMVETSVPSSARLTHKGEADWSVDLKREP